MNSAEKRKHPRRVGLSLSVSLRSAEGDGEELNAVVENLSCGGMYCFISGEGNLPECVAVTLNIVGPNSETTKVECTGRVVRHSAGGGAVGPSHVAVFFESLTLNGQQAIEDFVNASRID